MCNFPNSDYEPRKTPPGWQVSWHCHLHTGVVFCKPKTWFFKNTQLEFITKVDTSAVIESYTPTKRRFVVQRDSPKAAETKRLTWPETLWNLCSQLQIFLEIRSFKSAFTKFRTQMLHIRITFWVTFTILNISSKLSLFCWFWVSGERTTFASVSLKPQNPFTL